MADENRAPAARWAGPRRSLIFGSIVLSAFTLWGIVHVVGMYAAITRSDRAFALVLLWFVALVMLWWVPLSWFERPFQADASASEVLRRLRVTVQIPVYNEDDAALRACLDSVLAQTRLPDRVAVVDDGSALSDGGMLPYQASARWFADACRRRGVDLTWKRTPNHGKRHAQMQALAYDDADVFATLDSDSVLDSHAIEEGLKPFADPRVTSVAGSVLVLNSRSNFLTAMISILYVPFTRGFRAAQSIIGAVMVNSGTLAFYRADIVRRHAQTYPLERFAGRPMQMNDDSMLTMYALLEGRTVHQPSSFAFTLVPETWTHYRKQALRWMRGTFIRTLWWLRYMPLNRPPFWMALSEISQLLLALLFGGIVVWAVITRPDSRGVVLSAVVVTVVLNYLIGVRFFSVSRSDETFWFRLGVYALSPLAGVWRLVIMRPMQLYAIFTCRRVSAWGTRTAVEVRLDANVEQRK